MALSGAVTSFTWNEADVATTAYDVTFGSGFGAPKLVIVWSVGIGSATDAVSSTVHKKHSIGFGVRSSDRRAVVWNSVDAAGTADYTVAHSAAGIQFIDVLSNAGSLDIDAEANWPTDGIRFIVDIKILAGWGNQRVSVLAIGGSDLLEAKTFQFQEPGATGAQAVPHGLGGTPVGAAFLTVGFATAPPSDISTQGMLSLGFTDGTNQWVVYNGGDDGANIMDTVSYAQGFELIAMGTEPAVTTTARAEISSFGASNINLNWIERASTRYIFGLAWRGGVFKVDALLTATNTTPFDGPTLGFIPTAMLFASVNRITSSADTPTPHAEFSLGAATSASARVAQAVIDEDNVGNAEITTAIETDAVYINLDLAGAVEGLMDVVDMTVDPIALVMDDADPSACYVGIAAWGSVAAGAALVGAATLVLTTASVLTTAIPLVATATLSLTATSDLTTGGAVATLPLSFNNYLFVRVGDGMGTGERIR